MGRVDKLDSSFSRSRSSSMSSLENITAESIQCLAFADSYMKKTGKKCFNDIVKKIFLSGTATLLDFFSIF